MALRTRVKICGITESESAVAVVESGADALGMVFYAPSPRNVSIAQARVIAEVAHPFVSLVGLFVDAAREEITSVLEEIPLQYLQFHGSESVEFCESFGLPYIKALRVGDEAGNDLAALIGRYSSAQAVLLDTYKKGVPGGTGEIFNWDLIPDVAQHIILAGGLTAENVRAAIQSVKPYAVDTSGGVESAPGIKDAAKMRGFLEQVMRADSDSYV